MKETARRMAVVDLTATAGSKTTPPRLKANAELVQRAKWCQRIEFLRDNTWCAYCRRLLGKHNDGEFHTADAPLNLQRHH